jgi:hypothetical protein
MKNYIIILVTILVAASCTQKSPLPPINNNPVYAFEGSINNTPLLLEAGNSNMYMYTSFVNNSSPYATITTMVGKLALDSCTDCGTSIEIGINANKPVGNGYNFSIDSWQDSITGGLSIKSISFDSVVTGTIYEVQCNAIAMDSILSSVWTATGAGGSSNNVYSFNTSSSIPVDITLITNTLSGLDTISQRIVPSSLPSLGNILLTSLDSSGNLTAINTNTVSNIIWRWNDGSSNSVGNSVQHQYAPVGTRTIEALIIVNSDTSIARLKIEFTPSGPKILPTFGINVNTINGSLLPRANANAGYIKVRKDGQDYTSYKNTNSNQSTKEIAKVLNYTAGPVNEKSQNTLILDLQVDTYLYNTINNNDSIKFKANKMVWGVARP